VSGSVPNIYRDLNAATEPDLQFWTRDQLNAWANEGLASLPNGFEEATTTAPGVLPASTIAVVAVFAAGRALRRSWTAELAALREDWESVTDATRPERYLLDEGTKNVALWPSGATSATIVRRVDWQGRTDLPVVMVNAALAWALVAARTAETDAAMPEVAVHRRTWELVSERIKYYWGN
jgi:hypothetical protein